MQKLLQLPPSSVLTASTSQPLMSLLKAVAPLNMFSMSFTLLVSQLPMSWLKEVAPSNMSFMFFTLLVSQLPIDALKEVAPRNMYFMFVTLLVSHPLMSWLKTWPSESRRACTCARARPAVPTRTVSDIPLTRSYLLQMLLEMPISSGGGTQ